MPGDVTGGNLVAYSAPQLWADPTTALPCFRFGTVTIHCTVAPGTPYTIESGPTSGKTSTKEAAVNNAAGITLTTTISAVGEYQIDGGCFVKLTGGRGGTFYIAARS